MSVLQSEDTLSTLTCETDVNTMNQKEKNKVALLELRLSQAMQAITTIVSIINENSETLVVTPTDRRKIAENLKQFREFAKEMTNN